tara:strand:+ start:27403 stop:27813 length:411 start_codon:yes stop_codon:yes gene_type:complete
VIQVTNNWQQLEEDMKDFSGEWHGFKPEVLVNDEENILLTDNNGNYSLFEYKSEGVYEGHYLFKNARGRAAVKVSKEMLDKFFSFPFVVAVVGRTPDYHKGALWLNKQLGFETITTQEREGTEYEVVLLTRERFNK